MIRRGWRSAASVSVVSEAHQRYRLPDYRSKFISGQIRRTQESRSHRRRYIKEGRCLRCVFKSFGLQLLLSQIHAMRDLPRNFSANEQEPTSNNFHHQHQQHRRRQGLDLTYARSYDGGLSADDFTSLPLLPLLIMSPPHRNWQSSILLVRGCSSTACEDKGRHENRHACQRYCQVGPNHMADMLSA